MAAPDANSVAATAAQPSWHAMNSGVAPSSCSTHVRTQKPTTKWGERVCNGNTTVDNTTARRHKPCRRRVEEGHTHRASLVHGCSRRQQRLHNSVVAALTGDEQRCRPVVLQSSNDNATPHGVTVQCSHMRQRRPVVAVHAVLRLSWSGVCLVRPRRLIVVTHSRPTRTLFAHSRHDHVEVRTVSGACTSAPDASSVLTTASWPP